MKLTIQHFFLGLMIAFTISVLVLSVILSSFMESPSIPVSLIGQSFILSALCSLINLVYRSERIRFLWQSLTGYFLTVSVIIGCGLIFGWYNYGGASQNQERYVLISFFAYSFFYLITWIIIWRINLRKKKDLNQKLNEYKQRQII
jgi:Protein of unknown function (DUF3021).